MYIHVNENILGTYRLNLLLLRLSQKKDIFHFKIWKWIILQANSKELPYISRIDTTRYNTR